MVLDCGAGIGRAGKHGSTVNRSLVTLFFCSLVTLFFCSLVTLFISTCISPAQARAKCVSVYMECSGGEHRARILHKRVSLTASSRCQLSGTVLGAGTVHAYVSQTR